MTERSGPHQDGVGDGGPYSAAQWHMFLESVGLATGANVGVIPGILNELAVTSTGDNNITVNTGRAQVEGVVYENDASESKTTSSPAVGTTGRRAVLRLDVAARTVRIAIISSSDGTAAIPALTQTDGVTWEIPLASFTITTGGVIGALTDQREFTAARDNEVVKAADETVNNSAALQDDDELFAPVGASQTYIFEALLSYIAAASATPDIKFAFTIPAGATLLWSGVGGGGSASEQTETASAAAKSWAATTALASVHVRGIVVVGGTAGELQLQWAQNVATAEDTDLKANSWLRIRRV